MARGISTFDGRSRFSTWAYRIAVNAALDELRRRQRRPPVESAYRSGGERGGDPIYEVPAPGQADSVGEGVANRLAIDRALEGVSEEHRTALVLRDVMDLDYAEIAEVLRVPVGTVRSRIARGRGALARALEAQPPDPPPTPEAVSKPRQRTTKPKAPPSGQPDSRKATTQAKPAKPRAARSSKPKPPPLPADERAPAATEPEGRSQRPSTQTMTNPDSTR